MKQDSTTQSSTNSKKPESKSFAKAKRAARVFSIVLFLGTLIFLSGPRPQVNEQVKAPALPKDIDQYLLDSEAAYPELLPECRKRILWAQPKTKAQTQYAVLYLHGYSATRQELAPLPEQLANALGANLYEGRLKGHGLPGKALGECEANDWIRDGLEAYEIGRRLGKKLILIGNSTGSTLWTYIAQRKRSQDIAAMVLLSPNYRPRDPRSKLLTLPWGAQLAQLIAGKERRWKAHNALQEKYWTTRYPVVALTQLMALVELTVAKDWSQITCPTLVIHSDNDRVVSLDVLKENLPRMAAKPLKVEVFKDSQDPAGHTMAGDVLSPKTTPKVLSMILDFVKSSNQ